MNENNELIKLFRCNICNKNYSSQSSLCNHNKKFHINTNNTTNNTNNTTNNIIADKKYYCTKCNREFINYQNRWKHEKICKIKSEINNKFEKNVNENIEIRNILKELLQKNCKIHLKTLQKNNVTSDNIFNHSNNELKLNDTIRKTGSYNLINNYIEEDLEKYHNKDCVYIIHIKDNIYKYGNTSHIFKRLQAHIINLNYNKIIKIYNMNNMNDARKLENKIKTLVKILKINTVYNTHIEIFEVDNNNLQNLIKKIDELSLKIIKIKNNLNILLESEKTKQLALENENLKLRLTDNTKQLELENENLKLKLELLKLSK